MREYLIRTTDGEEFDIHVSKWPEVFRLRSFPSRIIEGWGVLRLEIEGCEISFSPEPPGTQIVFESGSIADDVADAIVREILECAERFTETKGEVVQISW